uniref:Uncharacterized protein n=1 Tax=Zea mays TaxID=4577 RepID=A0A804LMC8_MAIZE
MSPLPYHCPRFLPPAPAVFSHSMAWIRMVLAAEATRDSHIPQHSPPPHPLDLMWVRILTLNASYFLKNDSHFVISIKGNCIDSTLSAETMFAVEVGEAQSTSIQACLAGDVGALRA